MVSRRFTSATAADAGQHYLLARVIAARIIDALTPTRFERRQIGAP